MDVKKRSDLFIEKIENGILEKRHLTNHGENFTDGPEKIAAARFNQYLGSCGYRLMKYRIRKGARIYRG